MTRLPLRLLQDQMEAADCGRPGAAERGRQLRRCAAALRLALLALRLRLK